MPLPSSRTVALVPFAPLADSAVQGLDVHVGYAAGEALHLEYILRADLARLRVPEPKAAARANELWRHTCFEAFLHARTGTSYHEINASPSTEWAVYSFTDYRQGMSPADVAPPSIHVTRGAHELVLDLRIDLKVLPPSRALALAAVIEDGDGSLSYWALKHPAAKPDFHHPGGFVLEL
ncbi:MAG TPA: DOMON-like domain-containing protein [Steroidobacteraceae bacterium]|nr:DOMON-like domain-containing protein [Steroidobacteraceae bacterium]